jgi:hypothetical protein
MNKNTKRQFVRINTSADTQRIDTSSANAWIVLAAAANIIGLMILFSL